MLDFHSHILPGIDDGSRNCQESLSLISMLKAQGVDIVIATPHFYHNRESIENFISRRENSYKELIEKIDNGSYPKIILGSEVYFFEGIHNCENLEKLCIEGTNLLMLEMPASSWTRHMVDSVIAVNHMGNIRIVLAHLERYITLNNKKAIGELLNDGVLVQCNADSFLKFPLKYVVLKLLKQQTIDFIGSDCHNTDIRYPNMDKAYEVVKKALGDEVFKSMAQRQYDLINYREI